MCISPFQVKMVIIIVNLIKYLEINELFVNEYFSLNINLIDIKW